MKKLLTMLAMALLAVCVIRLFVGCSPAPEPSAQRDNIPVAVSSSRQLTDPIVASEPEKPRIAAQEVVAAPIAIQVEDAIGASVAAAVAAVEVVVEPRIDPPPAVPLIDRDCTELLIELEVGGKAAYQRKYWMPIYPGGESGVTIGMGYDLRYTTDALLRTDWVKHAQLDRLVAAVGLHGDQARMLVAQLTDVDTPYELAVEVFERVSLPVYWQITRRMFGGGQFDALDRDFQCGLFLVGYNRGGQMAGIRRTELRYIRDVCIPISDKACAAKQNRLSVRHWVGTDIEKGMRLRRDRESRRIERVRS